MWVCAKAVLSSSLLSNSRFFPMTSTARMVEMDVNKDVTSTKSTHLISKVLEVPNGIRGVAKDWSQDRSQIFGDVVVDGLDDG